MLRAIGTVVDWSMPVTIAHAHHGPFDLPAPLPCSREMPQRSPTRCRFANHRRSYHGKRLTHSRQDRASRSAISACVGQEMGRPRQVQRPAAPQTVCPFAERRRLTLDASAMCRRQPNRMPLMETLLRDRVALTDGSTSPPISTPGYATALPGVDDGFVWRELVQRRMR